MLTGNGGLDIAGLEWLGARAYDPASRGFLSTDPWAPVLGAGWDGNPYAYAGNNPLNTTDPTGLRPLTDDELKAYDKSAGSHWEYVVGGLSVAAGAALMFVPGGQVAGMGLISFGADVVIQKATKGEVNWAQSAAMGAVGLLGGGALTAGRAAAATASSASRLGSYVAVNAGVNGAAGAVGGVGTYLIKHGGRIDSWRGLAGAAAGGTVSGAVGGLAGPAGGTLARAGGYGAYTLTATGARPTLQAAAATTALGSGGAVAGTVTDKFISDEAVTWADVGWAGFTGGVLTYLPGGPSGSSTLQQAARTNVSTMSGLAGFGPNSLRLVRSSLFGTGTGSGLDVVKFYVFGN
jgi:RHS repeat-associated protein